MSETHSKLAASALGTLGVSLYVAKSLCAFRVRLGSKNFLTCLKFFQKLGVSRACDLYIPNKFHGCYRRVEHALNSFGASLKQASVRSMRVPILLNVASVACPKGV